MAAVYPAGPDPMMMTLRAVAISSFPSPGALDASVPLRDSRADLQDAGQLAQVADLVRGRPDLGRQRLGLAVDPARVQAAPARAEHVDARAVADEERVLRPDREATERRVEDLPLRLAPADGVGDHDGAEGSHAARRLQDVERRRRVIEVRDDREPVALGEPSQQWAVVGGELGGAPERAAVGVDQRLREAGRERGRVQAEPAEEMRETDGRRHLAAVDRAQSLGLTPALDKGLVARLEGNLGRVRQEDRMDVARGRAHPPPVQLDLRHPLTVEANQRVEEVEEDRRVRHQSGFRLAYPSSRPCQWRMSRSPYFQHKLTSRPSRRCGKSTRPSPRSFGVPPSSTIFSSASWIRSVNCLMRSVSARHRARSRTPPPASAIRFCSAWSFSRSAAASVCAVMTSRMTRATTRISTSDYRGVI